MDATFSNRLASPQVELYCDDGPQHQWWVGQVTLAEVIDRPYHARVELWSEVDDHQRFLGASCELLFLRESERRRLYGLIVESGWPRRRCKGSATNVSGIAVKS